MILGISAADAKTIAKNINTLMHTWLGNGNQRLTYNTRNEIIVTPCDESIKSFSTDKQILIYHIDSINMLVRKRLEELTAERIVDLKTLFRIMMMNHGLYKMINHHYQVISQKIDRLEAVEFSRNFPKPLKHIQVKLKKELAKKEREHFDLLFRIREQLTDRFFLSHPPAWHNGLHLVSIKELDVHVFCLLGIESFEHIGHGGFPLTNNFKIRFNKRNSALFSLLGTFNFLEDLPNEVSFSKFHDSIENPAQYIQHVLDENKSTKPVVLGYTPYRMAFIFPKDLKFKNHVILMASFQIMIEMMLLHECAGLDVYVSNALSPLMYALGFNSDEEISPSQSQQETLVENAFIEKKPLNQLIFNQKRYGLEMVNEHAVEVELFRHFRFDLSQLPESIFITHEQKITSWQALIQHRPLIESRKPIIPMPYAIPTQPFTPHFRHLITRERGKPFSANGIILAKEKVDFNCLNSPDELCRAGQAECFNIEMLAKHFEHLDIRPKPH